jgi:hypothetical protein
MIDFKIQVSFRGIKAQEVLSNAKNASVMGVTSRGAFIKTDTNWIIFLSRETMRGPLTLNMHIRDHSFLEHLSQNDSVVVLNGNLIFPLLRLEIQCFQAEVWESFPRNTPLERISDRFAQIKAVAVHLLELKKGVGLSHLLSRFLDLPSDPFLSQFVPNENFNLPLIKHFLDTRNLSGVQNSLIRFLGRGSGLTPSGDDLIAGMFLAQSRWGHLEDPILDTATLSCSVIQAAYQKTTLLSANLIECASLGWADERLVSALDGTMTGKLSPELCATKLANWGNSSGCDSFLGMVLVLAPFAGELHATDAKIAKNKNYIPGREQ